MVEAWDRVDNDPEIRTCILTGAGGYFCAGMDLKAATKAAAGRLVQETAATTRPRIDGLLKGRRLTKPLIAAVEGPAIAGGTEILQGTDIRVAGESAKFGISEAKWSLYPMGGSAVRLVRQIPYTIACDLLLTGRHITAAEALEYGLIGYVVPDGTALEKALEIAEVINNNGPLAVQAILQDRSARPRACTRTTRSRSTPPDRHRGVPLRRRQGRPAGVQGEARPATSR